MGGDERAAVAANGVIMRSPPPPQLPRPPCTWICPPASAFMALQNESPMWCTVVLCFVVGGRLMLGCQTRNYSLGSAAR